MIIKNKVIFSDLQLSIKQ